MKNTLLFGVFLAVMVCIGTIAGCALTNAMTGESPIAIVMRWRDEDAGGASKPPASAKKSKKDDSKDSDKQNPVKSPPDLSGEWKQINNDSDESWKSATISGDSIEVYWVADNGDTKSLYWAGTFVAPTSADEPYSWDSENDHEKTDMSLLASPDDTKQFTYENGQISYSVSALGTTTTIRLEKQS